MKKNGLIVSPDGTKEWYINGKLHREDGPAVEHVSGDKSWYLNDKLHREDGPAVEQANGTKYWYLNGKLHREDGPAVELASGTKMWYLNDRKLKNIENMTEEEREEIKNKYPKMYESMVDEWAIRQL
jgi:antitoxin component YwqK of YwqJK toxin-antitoxin module